MTAQTCPGRTVAGSHCELPDGHYPDSHHRITFPGGGFMAWTDEAMADFERIANEQRVQAP